MLQLSFRRPGIDNGAGSADVDSLIRTGQSVTNKPASVQYVIGHRIIPRHLTQGDTPLCRRRLVGTANDLYFWGETRSANIDAIGDNQ